MSKDIVAIIKNPAETLKGVNERIRGQCRDTDVTGAHIVVINGTPIITLTGETEHMADEDIEALKVDAATDPEAQAELKELEEIDFEVPVGEPLMVVVRKLLLTDVPATPASGDRPATKAMSASNACAFTEEKLNEVFDRADGTVHSMQFAECNTTHDAYALISYFRDAEVSAAEHAPEKG